MQPTASLQRTAGKATSKNLKLFFLENNQLCIMVKIFQVATSLSIFSTTISSLAQYRKQMKSDYIFTYTN